MLKQNKRGDFYAKARQGVGESALSGWHLYQFNL